MKGWQSAQDHQRHHKLQPRARRQGTVTLRMMINRSVFASSLLTLHVLAGVQQVAQAAEAGGATHLDIAADPVLVKAAKAAAPNGMCACTIMHYCVCHTHEKLAIISVQCLACVLRCLAIVCNLFASNTDCCT
jgi:Protein of unknown function (DUF561)